MSQDAKKPWAGGIFPPPPNTQGGALNALAQLMVRPRVNGLYYNGKRLTLDGYTWEGCRFDQCLLEVNSTNFEIIDCIIDQSTSIAYKGETSKIIELFLGRFEWAYEHFANFVPIRNSNGTITILDRKR